MNHALLSRFTQSEKVEAIPHAQPGNALVPRLRAGELLWVMGSKFCLMGANAALMVFLVNRLELTTYGLLVITISGQLLISRLLMMGVDAGIIRLGGLHEPDVHSQQVVAAGLLIMLLSSSGLLLVFLGVSPALSRSHVPVWISTSIVAGAIGTSLVDYGYSFRLASQQYRLAALAQGGTAICRLAITVAAALLWPAQPLIIFAAYHGTSLLSGVLQLVIVAGKSGLRSPKTVVGRLFRYSFWQAKANVLVILSLYQGTFLLMILRQQAATGIFGLGLTISIGFFAVYNAYFEYLLAHTATIETDDALSHFLRRAFIGAFGLSVACGPVILLLAKAMPWVLRPELLEVIPIFYYLAASMVLLILQAPLEVMCHCLLRPQVVSFGWLARAALIAVVGIFLASRMGAIGAAMAQLIGSLLTLMMLAGAVLLIARFARPISPVRLAAH